MVPGNLRRSGKWYCLSSDLRGYRTIPNDKVPLLCHRVGYLGQYAVLVDTSMPGANKDVPEAVYALLADMVLRFDTRGMVRDEAIAAGCKYLNGAPGAADDMPHIALVARSDIAVEYDFMLNKWRRIENLGEVSSLNNKTQHRDFVGICQPGAYNMTGEAVAKMVLSTQEAINLLGQEYLSHLDELLTPTRFKVLHPLDTKGYFLRLSAANIATDSVGNKHYHTYTYFPVWIKNVMTNTYYELNKGIAEVPETALPSTIASAGKFGSQYEVLYDTEAHDKYDTEQIAFLAALIMKSPFPDKTFEGVSAMYGFMEYLSSIFAPIVLGKGITKLPEIKGTRITNLDHDNTIPTPYSTTIGLSTSVARALQFSETTGIVSQVQRKMPDTKQPIIGECSVPKVNGLKLSQALTQLSDANPFEAWEAGLVQRMERDLDDVPPAYMEFFSKVPHIKDPQRVRVPYILVLQHSDTLYTLTKEFEWAEYVGDRVPDGYLSAGGYFGGTLYCNAENAVVDDNDFTRLLISTAQYFVDFSKAPTVFKYIFNNDPDTSRWRVTGMSQGTNCISFAVNDKGSFTFDPDSCVWSYSAIPLDQYEQSGPVNYFIPDDMQEALTVEMLDRACRAFGLCLSGMRATTPIEVPLALSKPRIVYKTTDRADWVIRINGELYTDGEDGWTVYNGTGTPDGKDTILQANDFIQLLLNYILYFVVFRQKDGKSLALFDGPMLKELDKVCKEEPLYDYDAYMYLDRTTAVDLAGGPGVVTPEASLPNVDSSRDNLMCVNIYLDSEIGVISLGDLVYMVTQLKHVDTLFNVYGRKYTPQEAAEAKTIFQSRQGAVCGAFIDNIDNEMPEIPLLQIGDYVWDGELWHNVPTTLVTGSGSLWGNGITYDSELENTPLPVGAVATVLRQIFTLFFDPKDDWYPILEAIRKRGV